KEDTAVEVLAVADALQLEDEISPPTLGLQVAGAVLDVDPALRRDGELRLLLREFLPAGEVLAVENRGEVLRLELDIAQGQRFARMCDKGEACTIASGGERQIDPLHGEAVVRRSPDFVVGLAGSHLDGRCPPAGEFPRRGPD